MIEDIIDSKSGSLVLGFFLAAPERAFSILEISKRLKLKHQKTAQALNKLASRNILKAFSKRGKKYYIVNPKYHLYPQLEAVFKKNKAVYKDELLEAVKNLGGVKAAFLSGLFTGYADLPVDILIVGRVNLKKMGEFLKSACKLMGQEVNYSIMTPGEFQERRDTFDKFIKDIFDYRHLVVVDYISKKVKKTLS